MYSQQDYEQYDEPQKPERTRFGEPLKFLPVFFCTCTIAGLYGIFVTCHCIPMLQIGELPHHVDEAERWHGKLLLVAFNIITVLLLINYVRAITTSPGEIPDDDARWLQLPGGGNMQSGVAERGSVEKKRTGDRRHCKWCSKYKPDRCHHCRVCRACVLKMDHHCPWIYNCVGFGNYKYFFLLLFYSMLDCQLILFCMAEDVRGSVETGAPFFEMFLIVFGETLAFFLGTLVTLFWCFHVWLMFKAMSTIEFCEKSLPRKDDICDATAYGTSVYDLGIFRNIQSVLGDNVFLWLLPLSAPSGDGLTYEMGEFFEEEQYVTEADVEQSQYQQGQGGYQQQGQYDQYGQQQGYGYDQRQGGGYMDTQQPQGGGGGYDPGYGQGHRN